MGGEEKIKKKVAKREKERTGGGSKLGDEKDHGPPTRSRSLGSPRVWGLCVGIMSSAKHIQPH